MGAGGKDAQRRARPPAALLLPLGTALTGVGLVQLVKVLGADRPTSPAGAVLALLLGAALVVHGLRRRYAQAEAVSRTAGDTAGRAAAREDVVTADQVLEQVRVEVLPGFTRRDEVAERVSEYFDGCAGPTGLADVAPLVEVVWSQRLAEESGWTEEGDYARVRAAFDDLADRGFVARMDFACCQTCGHAEIDDEREGDEHSYVFFHAQDTERLAEDETSLFLAFGCFDTHPVLEPELGRDPGASDGDERRARVSAARAAAETEVGSQVTESLQRHGLVVTWDRTPTSRPRVQIGRWRKPLPR